MSRIALVGAVSAALLLGGCSYSTESSFLGYRSGASFSTPGAAPATGYYSAPPPAPGYAPAYTETPPPAYAPAPVYYAPPPVYYGPTIGIGFGRWWGWGGRRRW